MTKVNHPTFEVFNHRVKTLLDNSARQKCYNDTGTDGPNQLFDFIYSIAGMGHALGEIIYKVIRYQAKSNPEDIEKVAAWAYLIWRKHHEQRGRIRPRLRKRISKVSSGGGSTSKRGVKTAKALHGADGSYPY